MKLSLLLLSLLSTTAYSADINLILSGNKYYQVTKDVTGKPIHIPVNVVIMNLDTPSNPITPPVGAGTPFEKQISLLTTQALSSGGTPTTATGIATVYKLVADSVADGSIPVDKALSAVSLGTSQILIPQADRAAWSLFRTTLSDIFDTLRQDGSLQTQAQYSKVFREVSNGINSVTGFNGSTTEPGLSQASPNAGLFGNIDIAKIMEFIKMLIELFKMFKPAMSAIYLTVTYA